MNAQIQNCVSTSGDVGRDKFLDSPSHHHKVSARLKYNKHEEKPQTIDGNTQIPDSGIQNAQELNPESGIYTSIEAHEDIKVIDKAIAEIEIMLASMKIRSCLNY